MAKIVVVGSLNMDMVVRTPRFPDAGETVLGHDFQAIAGGKGANQAVAAARQGAVVAMVGRLGNDAFQAAMMTALQAESIDTGYVWIDADRPTGVAMIAVDDAGENRIIVAPGANHKLSIRDVEAALDDLAGADALVAQLEIPLDAVEAGLAIAKRRGIATILNAAPASPLSPALLSNIDYLIVNEIEAATIADCDPLQLETAIARLASYFVGTLIVTVGERGALIGEQGSLQGQGRVTAVPSFAVEAVDTTGAGDAFVGAFANAIARSLPLYDAVRWANATGALATTRHGAQPSLPTYAAVAEFLAKQEAVDWKGGGLTLDIRP